MTITVAITNEVNDRIDEIVEEHDLYKEGFIDAILRLSLWDDAKVKQAVVVVKAYGLGGATAIESMHY